MRSSAGRCSPRPSLGWGACGPPRSLGPGRRQRTQVNFTSLSTRQGPRPVHQGLPDGGHLAMERHSPKGTPATPRGGGAAERSRRRTWPAGPVHAVTAPTPAGPWTWTVRADDGTADSGPSRSLSHSHNASQGTEAPPGMRPPHICEWLTKATRAQTADGFRRRRETREQAGARRDPAKLGRAGTGDSQLAGTSDSEPSKGVASSPSPSC